MNQHIAGRSPDEIPRTGRGSRVIARACSNIALVKYWGKRDAVLNLPAHGSLSLTLEGLETVTEVAFDPALAEDRVELNGEWAQGAPRQKVSVFLDHVRSLAGRSEKAWVSTRNSFPTAAGLASSASGFAALALAATRAAGLELPGDRLSALARMGSGSACRSIFGGFAEWLAGQEASGLDSHAVPLPSPVDWDVRMLVVVLTRAHKAVGSREGMERTRRSSPFYRGWLEAIDADLDQARAAIRRGDLEALGTVAESNALRMHATMLGARPPLLYWIPQTVALMQAVWEMRSAGHACWLTIDAGPNVKVLCAGVEAEAIAAALRSHPGVQEVIACRPGPGAVVQAPD